MTRESRIVIYALAILLPVLLILTLLLTLVNTASHIAREMLEETEDAAESHRQEFLDLELDPADIESRVGDGDWTIYNFLRRVREREDWSFPVTAMDYVVVERAEDQIRLGDENMVLAEFRDQNGERVRLPIYFQVGNSADVAQFLKSSGGALLYSGKEARRITGFWWDRCFYLTEYDPGVRDLWSSYRDGLETPEDVTTYVIPAKPAASNGTFARTLEKRHRPRSYEKDWQQVDALTMDVEWPEVVFADGVSVDHAGLTEALVLCKGAQYLKDGDVTVTVTYRFAVRYSPMALALGELAGNGTMAGLVLLFGAAVAVLIAVFVRMRRREVRRYQDQLQQKDQALAYARDGEERRREMTSAIAHELKTPLAVLTSYSEALEEDIDPEKRRKYLSVIREEGDKMDRMVLELLDLSRLEAGKYHLRRERFDLEALCRQTLEPLEPRLEEKGLSVSWQVGDKMVDADPYRMGQVVENFLTNAIRHSREGGVITIRIGASGQTLSVENQGDAIPASQLPKVWETFWQADASRNDRGSGLGLAICKSIVTLHGGSVRAENTAAGVRFSVSLDRRLPVSGQRMPREEIISLNYPVGLVSVSLEQVIQGLSLMSSKMLRQEIQAKRIEVDGTAADNVRMRLHPGSQISWQEYRINITEAGSELNKALFMEAMRPGGLTNQDMGLNGGITVGGL